MPDNSASDGGASGWYYSDFPQVSPSPLECDQTGTFEVETVISFESGTQSDWFFSFGDATPGAYPGSVDALPPPTEQIDDGGRCGSEYAMVLRSEGHNDWGSGFGSWIFLSVPLDGTGYDGLSMWARSPGDYHKRVALSLEDSQTEPVGGLCVDPSEGAADAGEIVCGDPFTLVLEMTEQWRLFLLPFSSFVQNPSQSYTSVRIDESAIFGLYFFVPPGVSFEMWVDDIGLYRAT